MSGFPPRKLCAPVYNVKSFGAFGDGVHDDTAAIQAAINAAGVSGGLVALPDAAYLISETLTCPYPGVIIAGSVGPTGKEGMTPVSGSRLVAASSAFTDHTPMIYLGDGSTSDVYLGTGVRGLNLLGNGNCEGIWLVNVDQGLVIDSFVNDSYSTGIFASAASNTVDSVRIVRCKVANTQGNSNSLNGTTTPSAAISIGDGVYYSVISECSVISNNGDGISLGGTAMSAGTGCKIVNCNADTTQGNQYFVQCGYAVITGNTTFNAAGKSALYIYAGGGGIVSNNIFAGSNNAGTQSEGSAAIIYVNSAREYMIRGNVIGNTQSLGSPSAGIYEDGVNSGEGCLYEGNELSALVGTAPPVTIVNGPSVSTFRDNAGYNPVGSAVPATAFALPASGTAWTNDTGVDGTLYVTAAGAVTDVVVQGVTVASSIAVGQSWFVPAGGTITFTYTTAPTLAFVGN